MLFAVSGLRSRTVGVRKSFEGLVPSQVFRRRRKSRVSYAMFWCWLFELIALTDGEEPGPGKGD